MRTVLLIEDDPRIRRVVNLTLTTEHFSVLEAATGREGLDVLEGREVDVVVLDLMLPDMDGFDVCREIRRSSEAPVIMVTARSDSQDVIAGLESGADDYVTKPFVGKELSARIRALLRRADGATTRATVEVGGVIISPREAQVTRDGQPISLTRTEWSLLSELAADPGRVLSREELLERVWGYDYFGDSRLVDVHVRRLRLKVEQDPANPTLVVTVRGLGYRLQP